MFALASFVKIFHLQSCLHVSLGVPNGCGLSMISMFVPRFCVDSSCSGDVGRVLLGKKPAAENIIDSFKPKIL
jgi:hypothetical protein